MSPERFERIEHLYHAAREGTPQERAALLAKADPDLRHEVELLLAQQSGGDFLERPAFRNVEQTLEDSTAGALAPGARLGPYRIEGKLGEGGMGEVFRAVDGRFGRAVAIKITGERFSDRFDREARAIASLNHPNICTLHDIGPNYLVMELVEGETIAARLKGGPLPMNMVLMYASQIASALVEAHAKGIVHRDLKPGNIMIAKSGVKVLDFGLAKSGQDETITASRVVMGTPAYMAPEQRDGRAADARSDIYSFGKVVYEMATGARATSLRTPIPSPELERIVSRCLEEVPERRWQSSAELQRELEWELSGVTATGSRANLTVTSATISRREKLLLAAATALLGLCAAYFYFRSIPKLTDKDTIVLADFVNQTSDPIFDGTLRQGLAAELEQSPFLKIMDDEQVQNVLKRMGLPPSGRITNPIAHEICVREGAAATIDGTIASMGKNYVVTLQAIACHDGATLAREQIQAGDKEHVLSALGTAATAMRGKLGESRNSVQKLSLPLEQATTPSLEALHSYTAGYSENVQGNFLAGTPLLERAIAIDPNFAMAYYFLGVGFEQAGDLAKSREYAKKAFRLIDRVSVRERDQIAPYYYYWATREVDKAIDADQLAIRNYPRLWGFHNNLSMIYIDLGRYEEGLKEGLEAARLQPNVEHPYRRLLDAYLCLGRYSEAAEIAQKLRTTGLGGARIHQRFLEIAYMDEDQAGIDRETPWFAGKPAEYISLGLQAAYRNVHGQRRESHKLFERAADAGRRKGLHDVASEFEEADARADALLGNCQPARRLGRPALALALCGETAQAEKLAAEASRLFPNGTIWNAVQLPAIRAALALHRNEPAKSVELLVSASPYERAYLEVIYLRGLAYLRLKKGVEAAAEFGKIVDQKGASWASGWRYPHQGQFYSLSQLGLARSIALLGDTAKAKKAFQIFFELWKDADSGIPVLQQAREEYARLP